jgi:hypothetical protein
MEKPIELREIVSLLATNNFRTVGIESISLNELRNAEHTLKRIIDQRKAMELQLCPNLYTQEELDSRFVKYYCQLYKLSCRNARDFKCTTKCDQLNAFFARRKQLYLQLEREGKVIGDEEGAPFMNFSYIY